MAQFGYGQASAEDGQGHDKKLVEVQLHLLDRVQGSSNPTAAKGYAEAYALISGLLTAKPVEIKQA